MQNHPFERSRFSGFLIVHLIAALLAGATVTAQDASAGDAQRGKAFFEASCAVCHSPELGPDNTVITKQGPSLVGIVGRKAGSLPYFSYTKAIRESGYKWDAATL